MKQQRVALAVAAVLAGAMQERAHGDEGMWLLTNPPRATLKERYGL
jgi:hypothetical protein